MVIVGSNLKDKYGLRAVPGNIQIMAWVYEVQALLKRGLPHEAAGDNAAKLVFLDYRRMEPLPDCLTVSTLLEAAKEATLVSS